MKNNEKNNNYVTVKIPQELADEIDKIINSGTLGYRSRAEMINDAIRRRIETLTFNNLMKVNNKDQNGK